VEECIEEINDWSLMIHPWAKALYKNAKKIGMDIRLNIKSPRKLIKCTKF